MRAELIALEAALRFAADRCQKAATAIPGEKPASGDYLTDFAEAIAELALNGKLPPLRRWIIVDLKKEIVRQLIKKGARHNELASILGTSVDGSRQIIHTLGLTLEGENS